MIKIQYWGTCRVRYTELAVIVAKLVHYFLRIVPIFFRGTNLCDKIELDDTMQVLIERKKSDYKVITFCAKRVKPDPDIKGGILMLGLNLAQYSLPCQNQRVF